MQKICFEFWTDTIDRKVNQMVQKWVFASCSITLRKFSLSCYHYYKKKKNFAYKVEHGMWCAMLCLYIAGICDLILFFIIKSVKSLWKRCFWEGGGRGRNWECSLNCLLELFSCLICFFPHGLCFFSLILETHTFKQRF